MKAVLISIKPKWCELIAQGEKTVEVRKTRPKLDVPFKCYIYMTAGYASYPVTINGEPYICHNNGGMVVIGEFVCDKIYTIDKDSVGFSYNTDKEITYFEFAENVLDLHCCLTDEELNKYLRIFKGYGWHISNLVIYDNPKELREFKKPCNHKNDCCTCDRYDYIGKKCYDEITRPPQSWCYVEELGGCEYVRPN